MTQSCSFLSSSISSLFKQNLPAAAAAAAADEAANAAFCAKATEQGPLGFCASRVADRAALSAANAALEDAAEAADCPPSPGNVGSDWAETTTAPPLPAATSEAAKSSAQTSLEVRLLWERRTMIVFRFGERGWSSREGDNVFLSCVFESFDFFKYISPFRRERSTCFFQAPTSLSLFLSSFQQSKVPVPLLRRGGEAGRPPIRSTLVPFFPCFFYFFLLFVHPLFLRSISKKNPLKTPTPRQTSSLSRPSASPWPRSLSWPSSSILRRPGGLQS